MSEDRVTIMRDTLQALIADGWSAAAIAKLGGVNQITIGNLKNGKASRITDKVHDRIMSLKRRIDAGEVEQPKRGRKAAAGKAAAGKAAAGKGSPSPAGRVSAPRAAAAAKRPSDAASGADFRGMINTQYVPVDVERLQEMIDALINRFTGAIEELESIKKQLHP